jgi:putative peptidoglycan lipid II flippase
VSLIRSFLTVGSNTFLSRVLGFAREVLIAATLGAGPVADAFYAAFRFPNLFRRLFAEGAFNSAFVPLFARSLEERGEDGARRFATEVLSALFAILLLFTAVVEIAAPVLVATVIAPGFADDAEKFDLTVVLSRIMFPYLACMSLVAMLSGILNSLHRYFAAAFAPVLLNLIMVAVLAAALMRGLPAEAVGLWLGASVFVAGLAQLLLLVLAVRRAGFVVRIGRPRLTPGVRRLLLLAAPAAIAGGITQINLFVGQIIASQKEGAIAILQYADRIYQLPLGVVGIAIGVVLLPELSRTLKAGHMRETAHNQNRSLEFSLFLTLPAAAALFAIPQEIVRVLYERGAFLPQTSETVAAALAVFALGLPAFVLTKVFSPGFFAREDTRTPMYAAAAAMAANIVLSLALFPSLGEVGIAWATTLSGWLNAALLFLILMRRGHWPLDAATIRRSGLICAVSLALGFALAAGAYGLAGAFAPSAGILTQAGALLLLVTVGGAFYFVLAQVSGAADLGALVSAVRRRRPSADMGGTS